MAKELGLNPHSLINNIPSPNQQWKLPVKQWIHELYEKQTGKTPAKKCHGAQPLTRSMHTENNLVPLHTYADEFVQTENRDNSLYVTIADWEEYVDE